MGVTGHFPPAEPGPNPLGADRPNRDACKQALAWSLVAVVLITVLMDLLDDEHDTAFHLGGAMVVAAIAAVPVGGVARSMRHRVRWWWYPPVVLSMALAVLAFTEGPRLLEVHRAEAQATQRLSLPEAIGRWHRDNAATQRILQSGRTGVERPEGLKSAVYRSGSDIMVLTTMSPPAGSKAARETATSPNGALRNVLAGAGVTDSESKDPGGLDGSLACGHSRAAQLVFCGWVGVKTGGLLAFPAGQISDLDAAAAQTRSIRKSITTAG